jgi:hypothetical protein
MVIVRSMPLRKADGPLTVHVPSSGADRPSWMGVGVIAVAGFVIGVAWPRLAGVRLGPSVPEGTSATVAESAAPAASAASRGAAPPAAPAATPSAPASAAPAPAAAIAGSAPRVTVAHGAIFSCKNAGGEVFKGGDCGALPGLDALVVPRLRKLADCSDAASTAGKLNLVVRADFGRDALRIDLGRDRGVSTAEPLLVCAKTALASVSLEGVAHDHARYSVAYAVTFAGAPAPAGPAPTASLSTPAAPAAAAGAPATSDGTAQVEWEVAIVRDAPRTGKVLARLQRGTAVHIGSMRDGWFPVKYGDGFTSDGWVYRGAIGR